LYFTTEIFAYDNTQILATSYSDLALSYYEVSLPYSVFKYQYENAGTDWASKSKWVIKKVSDPAFNLDNYFLFDIIKLKGKQGK
jgi:hypothetical protein